MLRLASGFEALTRVHLAVLIAGAVVGVGVKLWYLGGRAIVFFAHYRAQIIVLLGWLLASAIYAFSHAGPPNAAAKIAPGAVSSYTVTNVTYTLSATDPSSIAMVRFTIVPGSGATHVTAVRAKLISSRNIYATCANMPAGSQIWECPISGVPTVLADQLAVDAGIEELPDKPRYLLRLPIVTRPG